MREIQYLDGKQEVLTDHPALKPIRGCLGWSFTELDELSMKRARRAAVKYMQNYGKGRTTRLIDLSHYANIYSN